MILFLVGCKTTTPTTLTIPNDIEIYQLSGNDDVDIVNLLIQDVRWRMWAENIRLIVGEITKEEYNERVAELNAILEKAYASNP